MKQKASSALIAVASVVAGSFTALALWFALRQSIVGLPGDVVFLASQHSLNDRLFTYTVFALGMAVAACLAPARQRWYIAPLAGGTGYILLIAWLQNLFFNPDIWKFWERGHHLRLGEILLIGLLLGYLLAKGQRRRFTGCLV
ncbi:MAG: hypothetical protein MUD01_15425 [Chloroflexaceae bacterium]|nr:hypothetical protein [Chloroflexaceae bacterium]